MIIALLVLNTPFSQPVNGLRIAHSHEWSRGLLEFWVILGNEPSSDRVFEYEVNHAANHMLEMCQEVIEGDEVELSLNVCVLRELPCR
jgi:hypothetical protein